MQLPHISRLSLPDVSEAIRVPDGRAERADPARCKRSDHVEHTTPSRPSGNLACDSTRRSRAAGHRSRCERGPGRVGIARAVSASLRLPPQITFTTSLGPDRVAILHAIPRVPRALVTTARRTNPVQAALLITHAASAHLAPVAARRERSDQRARRASGASGPSPMQAKRSACPTGERSERTQPDASEAITLSTPLGPDRVAILH